MSGKFYLMALELGLVRITLSTDRTDVRLK